MHRIILSVVKEHNILESDYLENDHELRDIYPDYQQMRSAYWVVEEVATGRVVGGGGYAPLAGSLPEEGICEVQKMYFLPECRGRGLGWAILQRVLKEACGHGYRLLYAETHPKLTQAIALYERAGFVRLKERLGDTGHTVCTVHMARQLQHGE